MQTLNLVSHIGLWVTVVGLLLAVTVVMRQLALLHGRLGKMGARTTRDGLPIGTHAPAIDVLDVHGRLVRLGSLESRATLLVFVSPGCSMCADLLPAVRNIARSERRYLDIVLVALEFNEEKNAEFVRANAVHDLPYVVSKELVGRYKVSLPPYGVFVGTDGSIKAKGVANHLEHLESLLVAAETGNPTFESYIESRPSRQTEPLAGYQESGRVS